MFRPDGQVFDEGTRDRLVALVPHLSAALRMALQAIDHEDLSAAHRAAATSRRFGVVRVDADMHVLWAGDGATDWLAAGVGPLRLQQRRLDAEEPADSDALRAAVAAAIDGRGCRLVLGQGASDRVTVLVSPAQGDSPLHRHRSAQVLFSAPAEEARLGMLRADFGLTAAESRVALAVARGLPLRRIAGDLGVSYHTVRAHLRQCFSKTGVRRQSALTALVHERG
jgi:DNA-binding CsgD family transcriptional regulator